MQLYSEKKEGVACSQTTPDDAYLSINHLYYHVQLE